MCRPDNIPLSAIATLRRNPLVAQVIPLALGDSFQGFRIVGTEPELVAQYGGVLEAGELWSLPLDAVLGSDVARATEASRGDRFIGSHGLAEGGGQHADARYTVTGVLAPDRHRARPAGADVARQRVDRARTSRRAAMPLPAAK